MVTFTSIVAFLLAAGGDGEVCGLTCSDPQGRCAKAGVPCPIAPGACGSDLHCCAGQYCLPGCDSGTVCVCGLPGGPGFSCTTDCAGQCTDIPQPTGPRGHEVIELPTLGSPLPGGVAHALNNRGDIVGQAQTATGAWRPCLWRDGVPVDLWPSSSGNSGFAPDVNNAGQVLVVSANGDFSYLWFSGVLTRIRGLNAGGGAHARALNDLGWVVGDSRIASTGNPHAFLWRDGVVTDLGTLGGSFSYARDINNAGQVVGDSTGSNGGPFLWFEGVMTGIGGFGGEAVGINDRSQILGYTYRSVGTSFVEYEYLWEEGTMTDLDALAGFRLYAARAINNCGEVLTSLALYQPGFGFIRLEDTVPAEMMWRLGENDINDRGEIAGNALRRVGPDRWEGSAILMRPEPGELVPDGHVNLRDFAYFARDFAGPAHAIVDGCLRADFNRDERIDLSDFAFLQNAFTGSDWAGRLARS